MNFKLNTNHECEKAQCQSQFQYSIFRTRQCNVFTYFEYLMVHEMRYFLFLYGYYRLGLDIILNINAKCCWTRHARSFRFTPERNGRPCRRRPFLNSLKLNRYYCSALKTTAFVLCDMMSLSTSSSFLGHCHLGVK